MESETREAGASVAEQRCIDTLCDRFEELWLASKPPEISEFVRRVDQPVQSRLLAELLKIDVEYRKENSRHRCYDEYLLIFPEQREAVASALGASDHSVDGMEDDESEGETGNCIGFLDRYDLLEEIGRGGMGIVYKAIQRELGRVVAVKTIRSGALASDAEVARFRREATMLASLNHPGIVPIIEVGESRGLHFYSMEYVEGPNLKKRLADGPLTAIEAAILTRKLADAIHVAHQQGVVHRDLKPQNVLLDPHGEPRITDFGLAKLLHDDVHLSVAGQPIGTPSYMAPEQAAGEIDAISCQTDVYALGAVLYHLLTVRPPFHAETYDETLRQVREDEVVAPRKLVPSVPRDLETICLKCLRKKPARRYDSAGELSADVGRFIAGTPIRARRVGLVERSVRWCKKNRLLTGALLAFAVLVAAGGLWRNSLVRTRVREEESKRQLAETYALKYAQRLSTYAYDQGDAATARQYLPSNSVEWGPETGFLALMLRELDRPRSLLTEGDWGILDAVLDESHTKLVTTDAGGLTLLWDLTTGIPKTLCDNGRRSEERLRGLHHWEERSDVIAPRKWGRCFTSLAWLPGSETVLAASFDGRAQCIDTQTGKTKDVLVVDDSLYCTAISSDGSQVLFGGESGKVYLCSPNGDLLGQNAEFETAVTCAVALQRKQYWAVGREDGQLQILKPDLTGLTTYSVNGPVWDLAVHEDDRSVVLAVAGGSSAAQLLSLAVEDEQIKSLGSLSPPPTAIADVQQQAISFSADGRFVYAMDSRGYLTHWNRASGKVVWTAVALPADVRRNRMTEWAETAGHGPLLPLPFRRISGGVLEAGITGQTLAVGDHAAVRVWHSPIPKQDSIRLLTTEVGPTPRILFAKGESALMWALDRDGELSVVDIETDRLIAKHQAHTGGLADLAMMGESGIVASVGGDESIRFWQLRNDVISPASRDSIRHDTPLVSVAVSPDARWIAAVDRRERLCIWNAKTGQRMPLGLGLTDQGESNVVPPPARVGSKRVAFNCDGTRLWRFGRDQSAVVLQVPSFRRLDDQVRISGRGGTALMWHPTDPDVVVVADDYPTCRARSFGRVPLPRKQELHGIQPEATCIAFSTTKDGKRLVALEKHGRIRFVDSKFYLDTLHLRSLQHNVCDIAMHRNGRGMVIAGSDGAIEVWQQGAIVPLPHAIQPEDQTSQWSSRVLIPRTTASIRTDERMIAVDSTGRLAVLYTESSTIDNRDEGPLFCAIAPQAGSPTREPVRVPDSPANRRASFVSSCLTFAPNGDALAVFRLRDVVEANAYDGTVYIGRRAGHRQWDFDVIHGSCNDGFYPHLRIGADGEPVELVHFSHSGHYVLLSTPSETEAGQWDARKIGRQGDGLRLSGVWDSDGNFHMVHQPRRSNSDPIQRVFATWDGHSCHRHAISRLASIPSRVKLSPDGNPVIRLGLTLKQYRDEAWQDMMQLPFASGWGYEISKQGRAYLAQYDSDKDQLILYEGHKGSWSASVVAQRFKEGVPNLCAIRFAPDNQPILVVGCTTRAPSWLRILRPKK